jgi:hypothetical protein
MKPDEIAKLMKYARMIVDLGVGASLEGAYWAAQMKEWLSDKVIPIGTGAAIFCGSPDPIKVMEYFTLLQENNYTHLLLIFSDDGTLSILEADGSNTCYNMDISSCDTSHTPSLFNFLFDLCETPDDIKAALHNQIMAPMKVFSVDHEHYVKMKPKDYYLQSGITITTLINSVSQMLILHSLVHHNARDTADVMHACARMGYKVTLEKCHKPQDMQFLKMSPCIDITGVWRAVLNLAVILRASGVFRGDLPRRSRNSTIFEDATYIQRCLMSGLLSGIDHPVLNLLCPGGFISTPEAYKLAAQYVDALKYVDHSKSPRHKFDDEIAVRYDLDGEELQQLYLCILQSGVGTLSRCSACDKIFAKDYALNGAVCSETNT